MVDEILYSKHEEIVLESVKWQKNIFFFVKNIFFFKF